MDTQHKDQRLGLRAGDWVEVRSKQEILRTLDGQGRIENMPFMPEMFAFCGQRFRVVKAAHKTCDTISGTGGRSMPDTVHLEGLRCGGQAHDGCAAECLIFWKEAWLRRVDFASDAPGPGAETNGAGQVSSGTCSESDVVNAARGPERDGVPTYMCQATELVRATSLVHWWDVRQYVEDYRSGNVKLGEMAVGLVYSMSSNIIKAARRRPRVQAVLIAVYDRVQSLWGGRPYPRKTGTIPVGQKTPPLRLDLQPGELVRIRPHKEILTTLDTDSKNRGLYFDAEHVAYCGGTYKVLKQVDKIIDEKTGKMLVMKTPSVILDGVICQAHYSDRRMFCPRAIYPYWREIWLERAQAEKETAAAQAQVGAGPAAGTSAPAGNDPAGGPTKTATA